MADEDPDSVLSDVEENDAAPVPISINNDSHSSKETLTVEKFNQLQAELERERKDRVEAESSKSELQFKFDRLKALAHEAIKKRDESGRQRDEALREKDELVRVKDEVLRERDELKKQVEEVVKGRDGLKVEIENSAHMMVTGIEKISGKVSGFKNFNGVGLPRSGKYTGLPAVVYGVIKRANEIVEELVRQVESSDKSRNEAREMVEQRNYEIAIEVSQLEAAISGLREEVKEKSGRVESLEKIAAEKEEKIVAIEREMGDKVDLADKEVAELRKLNMENYDKLKSLETKIDSQRPLLLDQLDYVSKVHERLYSVIEMVDGSSSEHSDFSMFLPRETDIEESIRASLAGMESLYELTRIVVEKTRESIENKVREMKSLEERVSCLVKEKEHIGSLLRSALSKRITKDPSSKTHELFQVAENGLRDAGIDYNFGKVLGDEKDPSFSSKVDEMGTEEGEIYTLAGALENIVKTSQVEIIDLRHSVDELRAESALLKEHIESQAKELNHCRHQMEELEEKGREANENVEGLMMDIAAAEEEITRWKAAAEQEAAAGRAVEQELNAQLAALKQELEDAKQAILESEKKLKFKEETAAAAMAARDAAEKSLRLADLRASRLRDRVEELSRQLELSVGQEDAWRGQNRPRYMCWPWQWLGLDYVGSRRIDSEQQGSNEMELSEPLL